MVLAPRDCDNGKGMNCSKLSLFSSAKRTDEVDGDFDHVHKVKPERFDTFFPTCNLYSILLEDFNKLKNKI